MMKEFSLIIHRQVVLEWCQSSVISEMCCDESGLESNGIIDLYEKYLVKSSQLSVKMLHNRDINMGVNHQACKSREQNYILLECKMSVTVEAEGKLNSNSHSDGTRL